MEIARVDQLHGIPTHKDDRHDTRLSRHRSEPSGRNSVSARRRRRHAARQFREHFVARRRTHRWRRATEPQGRGGPGERYACHRSHDRPGDPDLPAARPRRHGVQARPCRSCRSITGHLARHRRRCRAHHRQQVLEAGSSRTWSAQRTRRGDHRRRAGVDGGTRKMPRRLEGIYRRSRHDPVVRAARGRRMVARGFLAKGRRPSSHAGGGASPFYAYFPIITSDDLITAETLSPTLRASSSTASLVIDEVTVSPEASSTLTCAVVEPLVTATTLPGRILRALSFMLVALFVVASGPKSPIAKTWQVKAALSAIAAALMQASECQAFDDHSAATMVAGRR